MTADYKTIIGDADPKDFQIQQYKGLGEMDAQQLAETTMEVGNRRLKQITSKTRSKPSKSSPI